MKKNKNTKKSSKLDIISNIGFVLRYLFKTNKKLYFVRLPQLLLRTMSSLINIYLFSNLINELTTNRSIEKTIIIFTSIAVTNFLISLTQRIISKYDQHEQERTMLKIKHNLGKAISAMPLSDIEQPRLKDFISLAQETNSFSRIIDGLTNFFGSVIGVITYFTIIVIIQPWIAIIIIANLIIQLIINKLKLNFDNKWRLVQAPVLRKLWYYEGLLCDSRCGKELRLNLLKNWILDKVNIIYDKECMPIIKANAKEANTLDFFAQGLRMAEKIVIYILLVYKVVYENMQIGDFSFYLSSTSNLTSALSGFSNSIFELNECGTFAKEFRYCIELSKERCRAYGNKKHNNNDFSIEFKNVSFKYPNTDSIVLKNICFKINTGEKLSLVGVNGSGKSTLVKLICRFYEPTEGEIYLGGVNIRDYDIDEYIKLLGVVFQDYKLFSFSVLENITMGSEKDLNRFEYSIINSGLKDRIDSLPQKEDTFIYKDFDEQGVEFSGGEGQKLTICRALYKNSPVIILDEPTASLDPIAEYEMYKSFDNITNGKTAIYISHRLSSTRFTDKIAVLQNGILCEFGNHSELMEIKDGVYRNMFNMQQQYYI